MRQLIIGLLIAACVVVTAPAAYAAGSATLTLYPEQLNSELGETFEITINVNPNAEALDTVRAIITFDPNRVQAVASELTGSFNRVAPGNYIDNDSGKVSLGGFTLDGSVSSSGEFGTVTFTALREGDAKISLSSDSRMIAAGEEKINISSLSGSEVVVSESVVEEGVPIIKVQSISHLNSANWYASDTAIFTWEVTEGDALLTGFYTAFDDKALTDPTEFLSAETLEKSFKAVEDGIHYFHIKAKQEDGRFSKTEHVQINVDTAPPNLIQPILTGNQILEGESVQLSYATTDDGSGVDHYKVSINGGPYVPQESPVTLEDLNPGTYLLGVGAVDKAGNEIFGSVALRVYPEGTEMDRPIGYSPEELVEEVGSEGTKAPIVPVAIIIIILAVGLTLLKRRKRSTD